MFRPASELPALLAQFISTTRNQTEKIVVTYVTPCRKVPAYRSVFSCKSKPAVSRTVDVVLYGKR